MATHNKTGEDGERVARNYLANNGYTLLKTNWRSGHKEVDIICKKGDNLVIVEVKTRSGNSLQEPWEAVEWAKKSHLAEAAEAFAETYSDFNEIQYDILSIVMNNNGIPQIQHIEDAFIPGID